MEAKVVRLDDLGRGIAYLDGKITFIEDALPNEIVEIEIIESKAKYNIAKVVKYIFLSPTRVNTDCPYYKECGGCNLRHLKYMDENYYKKGKVMNLVSKFTNFDKSIVKDIKYSEEDNYRNKVTLHGNGKLLGFYKINSKEIIDINYCFLLNDRINETICLLKKINKNISEVVIKTSNDLKYLLVDLKGEVNDLDTLKRYCDVLFINGECLTKNNTIISTIGNYKFNISAKSFFQINLFLTKQLYDETLNIVKSLRPNNVLDLYCGTGTIGIYVSKYCQKVIGIDSNTSNINDANNNKLLNNISNIEFVCSKVEDKIEEFKDIDLIIVDPPRAGLDKKTKKNILKIKPKTIVYTSCDPVTLVRDLNDLSILYDTKYIQPFNNFPKTYHVESVCLLKSKN